MDIGTKFNRPNVQKNIIPGGWVPLKESPYVTKTVEIALDYLASKVNISDSVDINITKAASQIVSGLIIYVEFEVPPYYVYIKVYYPFGDYTQQKIEAFYASKTKL